MKPDGNLCGVMAAYGKQHCIDRVLLCESGLCTMLLPFEDDPDPNFKGRYYHPWEAAAALGWPAYIALPCDIVTARHVTGNGLTTLQAVLGIYQLHKVLGKDSSFGNLDPLKTICDRVIDARPSLTCMTRGVCDGFRVLRYVQDFVPDETTRVRSDWTGQASKRIKTVHPSVPPTVPYTVQDVESNEHVRGQFPPLPEHIPMNEASKEQIRMWLCENIAKKPMDERPNNFIPMAILSPWQSLLLERFGLTLVGHLRIRKSMSRSKLPYRILLMNMLLVSDWMDIMLGPLTFPEKSCHWY